MLYKKAHKKIREFKLSFFRLFNFGLIIFCVLIGYLVVTLNNKDNDLFKVNDKIKSLSDSPQSLEKLKKEIKNNPELMEKVKPLLFHFPYYSIFFKKHPEKAYYPMRYGIISDIHSNLEALEAVVSALRRLHVQRVLCLGDIMGYGASPKQCLSLLKQIKAVSVAGNHDWAVSGKLNASYFPSDGKEAIAHNRNHLVLDDFEYLNGLDLVYKNQSLIMVHGTLHQPELFSYLDTSAKADETSNLMDRNICFVGHTHVPQVYVKQEGLIFPSEIPEFELKPNCSYIVNVGSVGQPRDENPKASFCIYDTDLRMIEIKRIKYDVELSQKKILEAGLPTFLAQRISYGK